MQIAASRRRTLKNLYRFSAVGVIFGSTGRQFANGCELEPTSEQERRERRLEPIGKNEPDSLQFPLQSAQLAQVKSALSVEIMEARVGFEPTNGGFADLSLGPLGYRAELLSIANLVKLFGHPGQR
jgi:hypothetical protein